MAEGHDADLTALYFEDAPCGLLVTDLDGTIRRVNRTFERLTGLRREELTAAKRFQDLLPAPARIYHETHYFPQLRMQGSVREIALELLCRDGSRLPVIVNARIGGEPGDEFVQAAIFDATERRRYERELLEDRRHEHEVAQKLQRSLLAGELPRSPRVEVVAHYQPAIRGLDVGGDWYDAFWLGRDRLGVVVGDVVGRGIEAAAAMGQLRSAARAFASVGQGPAGVVESLDGFAERHRVGALATVAYAEIDLSRLELRITCAGHPPPAMLAPGAAPRLLWEGRSAPLTVRDGASGRRSEAVTSLEPGTRVVLFTDGLVERRGEPLDVGLDHLLDELRRDPGKPLAALAQDLARALEDAGGDDDICLLAVAVAGPPTEPPG